MSRRALPRQPALPPGSVDHGAARVTAAVVPIFDKGDGTGADWRLITESLFKAAFAILDGLPDVRQSVARRVHEGSYNRVCQGSPQDDSDSKARPEGVFLEVSDIAGLKSKGPRPPH